MELSLYGVTAKRLNEQVKRNQKRFPEDFCFQLTLAEAERSRSQFATLKRGHNIKYLPYAFTEHGAIMAANVLRSDRAEEMSVAVVRAFVRLRRMALSVESLARNGTPGTVPVEPCLAWENMASPQNFVDSE